MAAGLLLLLVSVLFAGVMADPISLQAPSAYEVLQSFNFPVGLLPIGALGYELNPSTGDFSAYFDGTCTFTIQSYQIRYRPTISGRISTDRLSNLRGVSVRVLFFWINMVEIVRRGDELDFSVGILSTNFPVDNFFVCPQCGCGMDCSSTNRSVI